MVDDDEDIKTGFVDWFVRKCPHVEYSVGRDPDGILYIDCTDSDKNKKRYYFADYLQEVYGIIEVDMGKDERS